VLLKSLQNGLAVVEVYRMMGQPDYLLRIVVANLDAYKRLSTDQLAGMPYVQTDPRNHRSR